MPITAFAVEYLQGGKGRRVRKLQTFDTLQGARAFLASQSDAGTAGVFLQYQPGDLTGARKAPKGGEARAPVRAAGGGSIGAPPARSPKRSPWFDWPINPRHGRKRGAR